jgi:hypothetical protein
LESTAVTTDVGGASIVSPVSRTAEKSPAILIRSHGSFLTFNNAIFSPQLHGLTFSLINILSSITLVDTRFSFSEI